MEQITSKDNPRIKQVMRLLSDKSEREKSSLFVTEGVRLCVDASLSGIIISSFYVTEKALIKHPELTEIAERSRKAFILGEPVAAKISETKTSQGVFAVCEKRVQNMKDIHSPQARYLLLSSLQDPGNVGTIIRTAEAFGLDGVIMSADCPDLYNPKVMRATMGGAFRLSVWVTSDMLEEVENLKYSGVKVYASALAIGAEKIGSMRFDGACAVILGNEGTGLSAELTAVCDSRIIIPMNGLANSLSVATAAGIFAWEMKNI